MKKLALVTSALTFTLIAIAAIFAPISVARAYGFTIAATDIDAMNELRAIFIGFWLGLGWLFFRAIHDEALAKIGGTMLLLQAAGRAFSLAADGVPSAPFLAAMIAELIAAALILRPKPHARPAARRR
jgi:hypothetical protein